jgi:hypothetical protein
LSGYFDAEIAKYIATIVIFIQSKLQRDDCPHKLGDIAQEHA